MREAARRARKNDHLNTHPCAPCVHRFSRGLDYARAKKNRERGALRRRRERERKGRRENKGGKKEGTAEPNDRAPKTIYQRGFASASLSFWRRQGNETRRPFSGMWAEFLSISDFFFFFCWNFEWNCLYGRTVIPRHFFHFIFKNTQ